MAISITPVHRGKALLSRLKALLTLQKFNHTLVKTGRQAQYHSDEDSGSPYEPGHIELSSWKKLDSRNFGIHRQMISEPSYIVLKILQRKGFEAYLVGGCVRDLLLNRAPKDFDVITTAALTQIKKQFNRCEIVGRRFPICRVHVKGSVVEVSSFETAAKKDEKKEKFLVSQKPKSCGRKDLTLWKDCMHRDFTINSLFFDPFVNKIYDYANALTDLRSLKLRTIIPAQLSFREDCARILRGLRLAARLNLSFSKETESAIHKLSSSVTNLDKSRIMMEVNYMLSYGAAAPSLSLLWSFRLLEILLPFQAAYLSYQASRNLDLSSLMLLRLFSELDQLVTCDRPSSEPLWVALLVIHLTLVTYPQDALVFLTFASVLQLGDWRRSVDFAREHCQTVCHFVPEISAADNYISDHDLAERVTDFVVKVQNSIHVLTDTESLVEAMLRFPGLPSSGLVFISKRMGLYVGQIFDVLVQDVTSLSRRKKVEIDFSKLGKGAIPATRFALGKIIVDTMVCGVVSKGEFIDGDEDGTPAVTQQKMEEARTEQKVEVFEDCLLTFETEENHLGEDGKCNISSANLELVQDNTKKQKLTATSSNLCGRVSEAVISRELGGMGKDKRGWVKEKNHLKMDNKRQKVYNESFGSISQDFANNKQETIETSGMRQDEIKMTLLDVTYQIQQHELSGKQQQRVDKQGYVQTAEKHLKLLEKVHSKVTEKQPISTKKCFSPQEKANNKHGGELEGKKCSSYQSGGISPDCGEPTLKKNVKSNSQSTLSSLFK